MANGKPWFWPEHGLFDRLLILQLEDSENDAASLEIDDEVEFRVVTDLRSDTTSAQELRLTCKASEKRELGQVHQHLRP